jgi:diguanylate cyclase (GGDEF)-like protein
VSELKTDASQHFIALVRDLTEQNAAEEQIKMLAYYDTLTGLPNRRLFWKRLAQALSSARREGHKAALLFLDLDHFKRVNDSLGHWAGDALLKHVSARLTECIRPTDEVSRSEASSASLSRIGGDEFTILLPKLDDALDAAKVAGRLQSVLSEPFVWEGQEVSARVSTGIAVFPDDGEDTEVLVRNADTAMYHAKAEGRNNFQFYGEYMNVAAQRQLRIASDLRQAVGSEELTLHYQPVRDAIGGGLTAVEALLSWTRPGEDSVSPDEFIPIAEDMGLIIPLGDWVLHSACRQGQAWQNAGFPTLRIAVNVSARQLQEPNWAERVARILAETGLSPAYLDLELTESAIMKNDETTLDNVTALSQMGVGLTLDDFGTGFSSISYLNRFPINRIKIDSSFVKQLVGGPEHAEALVVAILAMARCMNIEVVGEGVETEEQVEFLREHGCHELQGFLLSPPVPADELLGLLEEEKPGAGETTRP